VSLRDIEALLREKIGLHAESIGSGAIERAVRVRATACKLPDAAGYLRYIGTHPDELHDLIDEIVVRETWFFREPASFDLLRRRFALRDQTTGPYRILSLPCSTGEEPYSIAMTLLDAGGLSGFEVHAVDVSPVALETAERAVYTKNSFRHGMSGHEHHFEAVAGGMRVSASVRSRVRFTRGNVLDPLLYAGTTFDAVFCRNLLIYLDRPARTSALRNLQRLLRDDGVLFAGHSEASEIFSAGFRKLGDARSFAFIKPDPDAKLTPQRHPVSSTPPRGIALSGASGSPSSLRPGRPRRQTPAPITPAPAPLPVHTPVPPASLEQARALADRGDLDAARKTCEAHLASSGPSAEAYCLLGIVRNAAGDAQGALESFGKALYMDALHYESLVHAALIHETIGQTQQASQLRSRAAKAARKGAP
jgi:chemotaxis protein methyltransferase WspC